MKASKRKPSRDVPADSRPPLGKYPVMRDPPTIQPIDEVAEQLEHTNISNPSLIADIPPPPPSFDSYKQPHVIYTDEVLRTNAASIPHMSDPLKILNTGSGVSFGSSGSTSSETSVPKDLRPAQPHDERDYFERLWAQNFERSEAQKTKNIIAIDYIPVGRPTELLQISGYTLAKDPESKRLYTVFRLELFCSATQKRWTVYRRYHDFKTLNAQLKVEGYEPPPMPSKTILRSFSKEFLRKRQSDLQNWLHELLEPSRKQNKHHKGFIADIHDSDTLRHFLTHLANQPPKLEQLPAGVSTTKSDSNIFSVLKNRSPSITSPSIKKPLPSDPHLNHQLAGEETLQVKLDASLRNENTTVNANVEREKSPSKSKLSVDNFEFIRVIGKGSFGKVLLVSKKDSDELYAMKILSKPTIIKKKQVEHTCTERRVLGNVNHPFIVSLHYAFQTPTKLYFVLDYCPGGDIFFHLSKYGCFPEMMAKFYCAEITLALVHLHALGIVYRDLKPENIMLDVEGHVKLADFGLAKEGITDIVNGTHTMCGTPEYLPPEILNRDGHGIAVDWWNLGMVLYEMLTGRPPWYTTDRMKLFLRLRKAELEFLPGMSEESMSFISGLLNRDPSKRLGSQSPDEALRHPFFYGIDWQAMLNREVNPPFQPCQYSDPLEAANFEETFTQMCVHDTEASAEDETEGEPNPEKHLEREREREKEREKERECESMLSRGSQLRNMSYTFCGFTYEGSNLCMSGA